MRQGEAKRGREEARRRGGEVRFEGDVYGADWLHAKTCDCSGAGTRALSVWEVGTLPLGMEKELRGAKSLWQRDLAMRKQQRVLRNAQCSSRVPSRG